MKPAGAIPSLLAIVLCHCASAEIQVLPPRSFALSATGEFEAWVDRRELIVMSHPWVASATGGFAEAAGKIQIPSDRDPPYRISVYCSDDYFQDDWRPATDEWLGSDGLSGRRFKQIWVENTLLWEEDVADANAPAINPVRIVEAPSRFGPGDVIRISLKVVDKVASTTRLESDIHHIGDTEKHAESTTDPPRFMTNVYWGDVSLLGVGDDPPPPVAPVLKVVEKRHKESWPPAPYSDPNLELPFELTLEAVAAFPETGFPVRCGIPIPQGKAYAVDDLVLKRPSGEEIGAHVEAISSWPDQSFRWVSVEFVGLKGEEDSSIILDRKASEESPRETTQSERPDLDFQPSLGGDPNSLYLIRKKGGRVEPEKFLSLKGRLRFCDDSLSNPAETGSGASYTGDKRFRSKISGGHSRFDATKRISRYDFHGDALSGCPLLLIRYRLYFDEEIYPPVAAIELIASMTGSVPLSAFNTQTSWKFGKSNGTRDKPLLELVRDDKGAIWLDDEPVEKNFSNWLAVRDAFHTHLFVIRHATVTGQMGFRLVETDGGVDVQCLTFIDRDCKTGYPFTAGEAKTFQVLYGLLPAEVGVNECDRIAAHFERPPLLVNKDLLCRSGAFGYALTPDESVGHELMVYLEENYLDPLGKTFSWGQTHRDFGDIIYQGTDSWRNGYYDLRQGFVASFLLSGDRVWADALERAVQHYLDVDMIHSGKPELVGLPHGYGVNHTSMNPWDAILRMNGVLYAGQIWGRRDFIASAVRTAKRIGEMGRGIGARSVRNHAGVLMSLATAYKETRDADIRKAAVKLIKDIREHRVDPRRGTYPEVHGNYNYRGNVPWMTAQLMEPLYLFYRESGELEAAQLLVGLAESILAENQERGAPGDIYGYSHNPHFNKTSGYHVLIAPCLFYAYELTGDPRFLEAGYAAWEQTVREKTINSVLNCFWNAPTLVHYLDAFRQERLKNR